MPTPQPSILVLGATGKTGRRVAARLDDAGAPIRRASRSTTPAFAWNDPSSWPAVLSGIERVYLCYAPDLAVPGAIEEIEGFVAAAAAHGVRRIVLLSGRGEPEAEAAERVVMDAGLEWTVLRCSWFMQNFSEDYLRDGVMDGELVLPAGAVGEPFVDADDIADVAAAALLTDTHVGRLYELTGPELLTFADAAAIIARATGAPLAYTQVPLDGYVDELARFGLPEGVPELLGYLFGEVLDGRNARIEPGVAQALERAPGSLAAFAARAAAAGAWADDDATGASQRASA